MTDHVAHENRKQNQARERLGVKLGSNASYVKGHQAMNDDVKKVVAWLRRTAGGFPHLETLLAHIDGEPARLAAAREEQREACADWLEDTVLPEAAYSVVREVRATPLTATPLADEIAALRAEVVSLRAHQAAIEAALEPSSNIETTLGGRVKALRARVAELEAERDGYRKGCESLTEAVNVVVAERDALRAQLLSERERLERWLTAPDGKQYERGTVQAVFDECDALRAQVEAARTYARQSLDYGEDCDAHDLLKAMDEAKP